MTDKPGFVIKAIHELNLADPRWLASPDDGTDAFGIRENATVYQTVGEALEAARKWDESLRPDFYVVVEPTEPA